MNNQNIDILTAFASNLVKQIKINLVVQRENELQSWKSKSANFSPDLVQEGTEEIKDNCRQQLLKLDKISILIASKDVAALKQIRNVYELVMTSNTKQARRDASLATLISLSTVKDLDVASLTAEEAFLFCNAMVAIPSVGFHSHERVIGNRVILDTVMARTSVLKQQIDIFWEVLDYCSDNTDDTMSEEVYMRAIKDSVGIILCHNFEKEQEQEPIQKK